MERHTEDEIVGFMKKNMDFFDFDMDTEISSLELDSFSFIHLLVMLEDFYQIEFSIDDMQSERFRYIRDIVNRVKELNNANVLQ